jgi:hypothetical protein
MDPFDAPLRGLVFYSNGHLLSQKFGIATNKMAYYVKAYVNENMLKIILRLYPDRDQMTR